MMQIARKVMIYCEACGDDQEFVPANLERVVNVRGEQITVAEPVLRCTCCNATQPDLGNGIDALGLAYAEYRRRHNLLTPEEIRSVRERYGLSREAFAAVLGMSPASLYRYEAGALQDDLHDSMIYACEDPRTMKRLVERRRTCLSDLQYERYCRAIAEPASQVG